MHDDVWVFVDARVYGNVQLERVARVFRGVHISKLPLSFNGLEWPVMVADKHVNIGCKWHTTDDWENFTDAEIDSMDCDALAWWRVNKHLILQIAKHHQGRF